MTRVLVATEHCHEFRELIETAQLPELAASYHESVDSALAAASQAEVLFGAPDLLVPLLEHCPGLRWGQSSWAGVKPFIDAPRRGYTLTGVKDIFGPLMSEYVIGWLLALERKIFEHAASTHWDDSPSPGLRDKSIGIMGTGSIGQHVAQTCQYFGMHVRGLNSSGKAVAGVEQSFALGDADRFADGLDYLVCLLPQTPKTDNLVNARLLTRLNSDAIVLNAGRANCLVEADLLSAIDSGQVRHAVIDVMREEPPAPDHPFWSHPGISITSHTSAPTIAGDIVDIFCRNYLRYRNGETLDYTVDFDKGY